MVSCQWYSHDDARLSLEDEEGNDRSFVEPAHSQIGEMMEFLKHFPFITIEQYHWQLTIPQIRIMIADAPKEIFLSEKQAKQWEEIKRTKPSAKNKYYNNADDFASALGI